MRNRDPELSTVQINKTTKHKLGFLASIFRRSMAGQLEWMVNEAYSRANNNPNPQALSPDQDRASAADGQ